MNHSRTNSMATSAVVLLLVAVAVALLVKNLALDNPMMPGDEYAYLSAAQTFPDSSERFAADPYLPRIYSPLFAAYGRMLFALTDHHTRLIKALNTVTFVVTMGLFLALIRKISGVGPSGMAAAVFLLFPFSAYTASFMPEMCYLFLFALVTWVMVVHVPRRPFLGPALAGLCVGSMLLVKPHAIAIFVAVLLSLSARVIAPSSLRSDLKSVLGSLVIFVVSAYVTLVGLNRILTGTWALHPFMFVGGLYRPNLAQGTSLSSWVGYPLQFSSILAGHLILLGALIAPALAVAVVHLRRLYSEHSISGGHTASRNDMLFALIVFAISSTVCAVAMTTNFETQRAQLSDLPYVRVHGRYYSFVIPLYLTLFFEFLASREEVRVSRFHFRVAALGACVAAVLLYYVVQARVIYPFDFPEAFVFSSWHGRPRAGIVKMAVTALPYAAIAAVVISYVLMAWRTTMARIAYPVVLIALAAASHVGVLGWQRANSIQHAPLHADARAMRQLIPAAERNQGLIVGPEWNEVIAHFLFNFESSPRVLVRPLGSLLTPSDIPPHTAWVILIGNYATGFSSKPWLETPRASCLKLTTDDDGDAVR